MYTSVSHLAWYPFDFAGVQIPPAPVRPMNLPLTNMVTEERTIMNKSSTFCFGASRGSKRLRQEELATGARARGLGTPGCDPVTPSSERNTRECMAVLRSNRPRILSVTDILVRSHTAPDLTAWDAGNTQKGSYIGNEKRGTFLWYSSTYASKYFLSAVLSRSSGLAFWIWIQDTAGQGCFSCGSTCALLIHYNIMWYRRFLYFPGLTLGAHRGQKLGSLLSILRWHAMASVEKERVEYGFGIVVLVAF